MYEFLNYQGKFYGFRVCDDNNNELSFSRAPVLWSASQSLLHSLKTSQGTPIASLKAFTILQNSISPADSFSHFFLKAIPKVAFQRGVVPEDTLKTRFIQVATLARRLDLVPAEGAPLLVHLLSYVQSLLLFKTTVKNPDIYGKLDQLDTNELLCLAEFWLNRGDLMQTLKYMNYLKGASRSVANQWMQEAKVLLETEQVAKILMAHAASFSFRYL